MRSSSLVASWSVALSLCVAVPARAQRPAAVGAPEAHPAAAASPASAAGDDDSARKAHAKALFERAANAYAAGHYYDAIESFLEVDRFYPSDQLPYNIAKSYDNLGNRAGALRYYREYLRRSPGAADKDAVTTRIEELETALSERGLQQVTVFSDPPDATVLVDDQPVGITPFTGETWPGRHRVSVRKNGYLEHDLVVELEPLKAQDVNVELAPIPEAPPPPAPASTVARQAWPGRMKVLTWVTLGAGTAALGTAVAIEAAAGAKGSRLTPATAFFAGVGTAAATVGAVMLYFDLSDHAGDERHASVSAGPERVVASYQMAF